LVVPQQTQGQNQESGWHRFGEGSRPSLRPGATLLPQGVPLWPQGPVNVPTAGQDAPRLLPASPAVDPPSQTPAASSPSRAWAANVTLVALTNGTVFPVEQYWRNQDNLFYESDGDKGIVALKYVDWETTNRLNAARNVQVTLRYAPSQN